MMFQTKLPRALTRLLLILSMISIGACNTVTSQGPVGAEMVTLDAQEWTGTWLHPEGSSVATRVANAKQGQLELAWIESESDDFQFKRLSVVLKQAGDWMFASIAADQLEDDLPGYMWARVKLQDNLLVLWLPRASRFADLVGQQVLPGEVEDDDVKLGELKPEHLAILHSERHGILYDWDEPVVLMRLD